MLRNLTGSETDTFDEVNKALNTIINEVNLSEQHNAEVDKFNAKVDKFNKSLGSKSKKGAK